MVSEVPSDDCNDSTGDFLYHSMIVQHGAYEHHVPKQLKHGNCNKQELDDRSVFLVQEAERRDLVSV